MLPNNDVTVTPKHVGAVLMQKKKNNVIFNIVFKTTH